jgi:ferredoxin
MIWEKDNFTISSEKEHVNIGFYKDYYLFKWMGVSNLWRNFRMDETCDSCKLCSEIFPTNSIQMVDNKPNWLKTCEQCVVSIIVRNKQFFKKVRGA